jgi:hypothetical protein
VLETVINGEEFVLVSAVPFAHHLRAITSVAQDARNADFGWWKSDCLAWKQHRHAFE